MRAVVQRVSAASVRVNGAVLGRCGKGLVLLVAAHRDDTPREVRRFADKIASLRIFGDAEGKMNLSLNDLAAAGERAGVLAVSNFTIYGDTSKNRRPSFAESAPYEVGRDLYDLLVASLRDLGLHVECGQFGAHMTVSMDNDGPVTVVLDVPPAST